MLLALPSGYEQNPKVSPELKDSSTQAESHLQFYSDALCFWLQVGNTSQKSIGKFPSELSQARV